MPASKLATFGLSMLLCASAVVAQPSVTNPSFEADVLADGAFIGTGGTAWTLSGPSTGGPLNPNTTAYTSAAAASTPTGASGTNVGFTGTTAGTRLCQDVGGTIQVGNTYTLGAVVGWRNNLVSAPIYSLEIYSTAGGGGPGNLKTSKTASPTTKDAFNADTLSYLSPMADPDAGSALTICLGSGAGNGGQNNFDAITMTPVELMSFSVD